MVSRGFLFDTHRHTHMMTLTMYNNQENFTITIQTASLVRLEKQPSGRGDKTSRALPAPVISSLKIQRYKIIICRVLQCKRMSGANISDQMCHIKPAARCNSNVSTRVCWGYTLQVKGFVVATLQDDPLFRFYPVLSCSVNTSSPLKSC